MDVAAADADPRVRMLAIRLARQLDDVDALDLVTRLVHDASPQVRRECAIALHGQHDPRVAQLWTRLAQQYEHQDRWYLEALGIAAAGQWDSCLEAWLKQVGSGWNTPEGRSIVWRSRADKTPELLGQLIADPTTPEGDLPRYLRALDFLRGPTRDAAIGRLAFHTPLPDGPRKRLVQTQALTRLGPEQVPADGGQRQQLDALLDSLVGTPEFLQLVERFQLQDRFEQVLQLAIDNPAQTDGIDAVRMLMAAGQSDLLSRLLKDSSSDRQLAAIQVLGRSADNRALPLLRPLIHDPQMSSESRRAAIHSLAQLRAGAEFLIEQSERGTIPADLTQAVAADLHQIPWRDLRERAVKLYPLTLSKDNKPFPAIRDLVGRTGEVTRGESVFRNQGTCAKCHVVDGQGTPVGPELSEIGNKLSHEAIFESILYPSAGISHSYETFTVELNDGNIVSGLLVSQTDDEIDIKNNEGITRRFAAPTLNISRSSPSR